jgi:heme-degrading monooxygenase HmoA
MILREWRARAEPARADAYPHHFRDMIEPDLRNFDGFLGAELIQRLVGDQIEFVVLTRWESMNSIVDFAGETLDQAKVDPGAAAALITYDDTVRHYEIIEEVTV